SGKVSIGSSEVSKLKGRLSLYDSRTIGLPSTLENATLFIGQNESVYLGIDANQIAGSEQLYLQTLHNHPITFQTNAIDRMRITGSGRVGIGTNSPVSLVHVSAGPSGDAILRIEADTDNSGSEAD